eukprot:TRINITY_DN25543_c0_g1_i2.p1 TRINITY_DN25543_c0_g1~~TRINITY_DN25543_c0_g1_i2.p1  ORF type:complete len:654 (-),score=104.60 TRINITY_DN25543_c0_g1_i2:283-2112(-)
MALVALGQAQNAKGHVTFVVLAETRIGDELRLVGAPSSWGSWNVDRGIPLQTRPDVYPMWSTTVPVPTDVIWGVEYKFVIVRQSDGMIWEDGQNRELTLGGVVEGRSIVARFNEVNRSAASLVKQVPRSMLPRSCVVIWEVKCESTLPGDELVVVGSCSQLGRWRPEQGLRLTTSEQVFPRWLGYARFQVESTKVVAWKLAKLRADNGVEWEEAAERTNVLMAADASSKEQPDVYVVRATFSSTQSSKCEGSGACLSQVGSTCSTATTAYGCHRPCLDADSSSISGSVSTSTSPDTSACSSELVSPVASGTEQAKGDSSLPAFDVLSLPAAEEEQAQGRSLPLRTALWAGARRLPKAKGRCEDACFIGVDCLGVAENLLELSARALRGGCQSVKEAMMIADKDASTYGASTLTLARLSGSALEVGNLGDSGFMVLRPKASNGAAVGEYEIVCRSSEQQHAWNKPFQLMRVPPALLARVPPGTQLDTANDADHYVCEVVNGDLVILYTDGFSDNMHDSELVDVIYNTFKDQGPEAQRQVAEGWYPRPEKLARELAMAAQANARSETAEVPFVLSSREQGFEWTGGKEDDITVVAAWVVDDDIPRMTRSRS